MKKSVLVKLAATAVLLTAFTSCNQAKFRSVEEIKKSGTVKIAVFSDKKPFGYVDEYGKYQGYDVFFGERIAKDLGVADHVKIIGRLNHDDVFKWLDNIDVYVHPSCQEGLSRAIIEAMSRACPIVGADTGGIHELIQDEYIVPKKDVSSIAEAIQLVINGDLKSIVCYNFENSKEYVKSVLYKRREEYFNEFLKSNNLL